jgi:hypothetical protein
LTGFFDTFVKYPNQLWLGDFCVLTKRPQFFESLKWTIDKNYKPQHHGDWRKKGMRKKIPFFPKWVKCALNDSSITHCPIYRKPIVMFCVKDVYSRMIIHACVKECPSIEVGYIAWFDLYPCFKEIFELAVPHRLCLDNAIFRRYGRFIKRPGMLLDGVMSGVLSPLESFFARFQYEYRGELTDPAIKNWVHYYNYERKSPALQGLTPHQIYSASPFP